MGHHARVAPETDGTIPPPRRYLWMLRHAKAATGSPGGDHARPLTERGRRDAAALASRLTAGAGALAMVGPDGEDIPPPELVVCSTAVRTTETAALALTAPGGVAPEVRRERAVYGASVPTALGVLRELGDAPPSVVLVGHNPTAFSLTWELLDPTGGGRERLEAHGFPTCTLAVVALPAASWAEVELSTGRLCGVASPPY